MNWPSCNSFGMIFSGHTLQIQTQKLIQKWAAKMYQLKKCIHWFCRSKCVNFRKRAEFKWSIFQWQLMISEFMKPKIYLIRRLLSNFSSMSLPAGQANKSGNEPANQSISLWLSVNQFICHTVSQSVSNWACQPVNWSEVLLLSHIRIDQWSAVRDDDGRVFWSWVVCIICCLFVCFNE